MDLFNSFTNLSGNPSNIVFPPESTISLYKVILKSMSTLAKLFATNWTTAE